MCGIAGHWTVGVSHAESEDIAARMAASLRHRGPDDSGTWIDPRSGLAFGHSRLSILDLSQCGHQPMVSESGRYVLCYNGEVYNHEDLRAELRQSGTVFRGHSDTEVMLLVIERLGLDEATRRFSGMFAFALFDRDASRVHLVRDRIGEKPLYYGWSNGALLFGSELKALRQHPSWSGRINRSVLALYVRHNYVPSPYSIFEGIQKVLPGTIVSFQLDQPQQPPTETAYWSPSEQLLAARDNTAGLEGAALVGSLGQLLGDVVEREMISDVPLGAFLSGGIDSSLVVALMQQRSELPVQTFTIGFEESQFNEAEYAADVAEHLGTEHTELYVTPGETRDVIPRLPTLYDEPFADSSQIPTFLVSQMASKHVTVCLTGDGGDELFGGYERYLSGERAWSFLRKWPGWARSGIASLLRGVPETAWNSILSTIPAKFAGHRITGYRLHRLAEVLGTTSPKDLYRALVTYWPDSGGLVKEASELPTLLSGDAPWPPHLDPIEGMMLADLVTYLPDDILVKVDRAGMGVSLETRAPFLDHSVVEFAWRIPVSRKVSGGRGKLILRELLDQHVPRELVERPKAGFSVPIGEWLRGPLRPWAEELLDPQRLESEGYFEVEPIRRRWQEHLSGVRSWEYQLWGILMFQAWLEQQ